MNKELVPKENWYGELVPEEEVYPLASAPLVLARYSFNKMLTSMFFSRVS